MGQQAPGRGRAARVGVVGQVHGRAAGEGAGLALPGLGAGLGVAPDRHVGDVDAVAGPQRLCQLGRRAGDHRALGRADDLRLGRRRVDGTDRGPEDQRGGARGRPCRAAGDRADRGHRADRLAAAGPGAARAVGVGAVRRRRGRRRPRGAGPASTARVAGLREPAAAAARPAPGSAPRDSARGRRGGRPRVGRRVAPVPGPVRPRGAPADGSAAARRSSPSWRRGAPRPSRRLSARVLRR